MLKIVTNSKRRWNKRPSSYRAQLIKQAKYLIYFLHLPSKIKDNKGIAKFGIEKGNKTSSSPIPVQYLHRYQEERYFEEFVYLPRKTDIKCEKWFVNVIPWGEWAVKRTACPAISPYTPLDSRQKASREPEPLYPAIGSRSFPLLAQQLGAPLGEGS